MFAVYAKEPNADDPLSSLVVGERPDPRCPGWVRCRSRRQPGTCDIWTLRGGDQAGSVPDDSRVRRGRRAGGRHRWCCTPSSTTPRGGAMTLDPKRTLLTEKYQGTFADGVVVPARNVLPKPAGLSFAEAATMGTAWLTAYRMLFVKSGCGPARRCWCRASGGVATALVQLGRTRRVPRVGDRPHGGARWPSSSARHLRAGCPPAGAGGRRVRDRGRGHVVALAEVAEARRHRRGLRVPPVAPTRAPTCSGCSSCGCVWSSTMGTRDGSPTALLRRLAGIRPRIGPNCR